MCCGSSSKSVVPRARAVTEEDYLYTGKLSPYTGQDNFCHTNILSAPEAIDKIVTLPCVRKHLSCAQILLPAANNNDVKSIGNHPRELPTVPRLHSKAISCSVHSFGLALHLPPSPLFRLLVPF
jgi:hypothetical protein